MNRLPVVTLYGRSDCHLCEEARVLLETLGAGHCFVLEAVDVDLHDVLTERYGEVVPVIELDGVEIARVPIDRALLAERLSVAPYGTDC